MDTRLEVDDLYQQLGPGIDLLAMVDFAHRLSTGSQPPAVLQALRELLAASCLRDAAMAAEAWADVRRFVHELWSFYDGARDEWARNVAAVLAPPPRVPEMPSLAATMPPPARQLLEAALLAIQLKILIESEAPAPVLGDMLSRWDALEPMVNGGDVPAAARSLLACLEGRL